MWRTDVVTSELCVALLVDGTSAVVDLKVVKWIVDIVVEGLLLVKVSLSSAAVVKVLPVINGVLTVECSEEVNEGAFVELVTMSWPAIRVEMFSKFICPFSVIAPVKTSERHKVSVKKTVSMTLVLGKYVKLSSLHARSLLPLNNLERPAGLSSW